MAFKRAFYDSKACICSFEPDTAVKEGDAVATAILEAATETVGQFDWFGIVQHGGNVAKMMYTANED